MAKRDSLVEAAKDAADQVMADQSVSAEKTLERLEEVKDHIEMSIEALKADLK